MGSSSYVALSGGIISEHISVSLHPVIDFYLHPSGTLDRNTELNWVNMFHFHNFFSATWTYFVPLNTVTAAHHSKVYLLR